jgi:hypothetical protein
MISYRQADLLEYRKKGKIKFYLSVHHAAEGNPSDDRISLLHITNVIDLNRQDFAPKRSVELAMAFEIFDDYERSLGAEKPGSHLWHGKRGAEWVQSVEEFENYLKSRPEITDVEFVLMPNNHKTNWQFNDTYECHFSIFTTLVPKGIE